MGVFLHNLCNNQRIETFRAPNSFLKPVIGTEREDWRMLLEDLEKITNELF